jgi:hypothetical protein
VTAVVPRAAGPFLAALALALAASAPAPAQPALGQVDNFQNGTTQNWTNGGGVGAPPVVNVATGGPAGAGDAFLQFSALGGGGSGSRLVVFNRTQWAGNFAGPGITAVELDLKNISGPTLSMRVGLKSSTGIGAPGYESTTAFSLPGDGAWHHATFLLDSAHLSPVNSPAPLDSFLTSVAEFRILSQAGPTLTLNGDAVAATVGADNIHAFAPVPEPGWLLLAVAGGGALGRTAVRAHRRARWRRPKGPR